MLLCLLFNNFGLCVIFSVFQVKTSFSDIIFSKLWLWWSIIIMWRSNRHAQQITVYLRFPVCILLFVLQFILFPSTHTSSELHEHRNSLLTQAPYRTAEATRFLFFCLFFSGFVRHRSPNFSQKHFYACVKALSASWKCPRKCIDRVGGEIKEQRGENRFLLFVKNA